MKDTTEIEEALEAKLLEAMESAPESFSEMERKLSLLMAKDILDALGACVEGCQDGKPAVHRRGELAGVWLPGVPPDGGLPDTVVDSLNFDH